MSWPEAGRLVTLLCSDPSSWTAAATQGWAYPASREALTLADLIDVQIAKASSKKQPPYQRPWSGPQRKQRGNSATRTPAEVRSILQKFGHGADDETKEAHSG